MEKFRDILKVQGVKAKGYGIVPKMVMLDRKLTIEAKSIYAYFCSYAGAGDTAFPSRDKICNDLCIGKTRYYNHRDLLVKYGYLEIEQVRSGKNRFSHNVYTLVDKPIENTPFEPSIQNEDTAIKPSHHNEDTVREDTQGKDININKSLENQQSSLLLSIIHSEEEKENEGMNEFQDILNNSNYNDFEEDSPAIELAIRLLYYSDKPLDLKQMSVPSRQVREDLKRLRWKHIDLALRDFKNATETQQIRNVTAYLSKCIYNSIFNSNLKLEAELKFNNLI